MRLLKLLAGLVGMFIWGWGCHCLKIGRLCSWGKLQFSVQGLLLQISAVGWFIGAGLMIVRGQDDLTNVFGFLGATFANIIVLGVWFLIVIVKFIRK